MYRAKVIGVVLLALMMLSFAQGGFHSAAFSQDFQRPAQIMLKWGTDHLPYPEWVVRIEEDRHEAFSVWRRSGAVIRYRQLFEFGSYSMEKLKALLNEKWLKATMQDYSSWEKPEQCTAGNFVIFDLKAQTKNDKELSHRVRIWVWSDQQAYSEVMMAFEDAQAAELEAVADKLFGKAARCNGVSATKVATSASG